MENFQDIFNVWFDNEQTARIVNNLDSMEEIEYGE